MQYNSNKFIIDRVEGNIAVCEDNKGNMININIKYIIGKIKEGSVIIKKNSLYYIDENLTKKRKKEIEELVKGLWVE
ncbi:DUF3006 domain-containing protein [Clostridium fallax]|uniref:DUF3006 domain-containing protein n=1 Tax=Clostridium fallax TaxID=1533 RepID=A0A1M4XPX6_9CLOT|nr:DUF3006 domain-containing protein [Clostridium fallax]SHE95488.1 Protein of unknown function [Clostridium fallax]SQB08091.1 Protein of uncharacterised function (DUF3006) [Clostridium fallax]